MLTIKIVSYILAGYLGFYSFYWLFATLLGTEYKGRKGKENKQLVPSIIILLPAYKPGKIFSSVLQRVHLLKEKHPNIEVLCLMQHARDQFIQEAKSFGFLVEDKAFDHLEGNSYHHALKYLVKLIQNFNTLPQFTMILDKDNIIDSSFLEAIPADYFDKYEVIQGKREALSSDGSTSLFDQVSELLNDVMFRAANSRLKTLPEISGSAALIETKVFCNAIKNLDLKAPGYDKSFMVQLLTGNPIKGIFVPEAKIYEEKTDDLNSFQPQRVRWFGEQYYNALFSGKKLINAWLNGSWSAFIYLIILWRPPRSIQLFIVPLLGVLESTLFLVSKEWFLGFPVMSIASLMIIIAILIFLIHHHLLGKAIIYGMHLPGLVFANFKSAFNSIKPKNRGQFIHTEHKL